MAQSINSFEGLRQAALQAQGGNARRIHTALSGWPMVVAWVGMMIFALHACTRMVGAGDTWVALACGRHFYNHGVNTVEPFSANSHKPGPTEAEIETWPGPAKWLAQKVGLKTVQYWHPTGWINQNWLTHVIFYWLTSKSPFADAQERCFNTLVYWKFTIYILCIICVYYTGRLLGVNPALSAAFACFALFTGRSFFDIRPAGFSNMLVAVFFLVLVLATYRNILYLWLMVPLVVLWCNLHGGYIYAFIMLMPFFLLHLLILLPRKWTVCIGSVLAWMGLYLITYKFLGHAPLVEVSPMKDPLFHLLLAAIAAAFVLTAAKNINPGLFYGFYVLAMLVLFIGLLARYFPQGIDFRNVELNQHIRQGRMSLCMAFVAAVAFGAIVTFAKDSLVSIKEKGLYHTIGVGATAFIAAVLFNPFHLTNFTHTFVISVSKNAERWRSVNEWHPGFEWSNPVGTGFPFLVLCIMSAAVTMLWLISRFLKPKLFKGPRNELERQRSTFLTLSKVFGWAAAIFMGWIVFTSFSFLSLDAGNFFFCAIFAAILLAAVLFNIHLIYLEILLVLMAMGTTSAESHYLGRYIYPFVLVPSYVLMHAIASRVSEKVESKPVNIAFVAAAAVVSLFLMLAVFEPFGTGPLWDIRRLLDIRRPWLANYEGETKFGYAYLFPALYIINGIAVLLYLVPSLLAKASAAPAGKPQADTESETYQLPQVDLALLVIAALTVYMAYRSRRFIPIAAIAACPVLAMLIDQMARTISAARNFYRPSVPAAAGRNPQTPPQGRFAVSPMPNRLEMFIALAGLVVVISLGTWWTLKFKRVYLDPWPTDPKLTSVFMRMTASDAKPFYAMDFIRENKFSGKMFNYWTEGGFIAWGQDPDPNTGKTPLQLFMDGRAQAAYDQNAYDLWSNIMAGGNITFEFQREALARNKSLTADNYRQIGQWIDGQLRFYNVWVVLMPIGQSREPFVLALDQNPNWPLAFYNDKMKLFVDIRQGRAQQLLDGVINGKTCFPDDFTKNLMASRLLYMSDNSTDHRRGFDAAKRAFEIQPSQASMQQIFVAVRFPETHSEVIQFCKDYYQHFVTNKKQLAKQNGYHHNLVAALMAADYLAKISPTDSKAKEEYSTARDQFENDSQQIVRDKRW